MLGQVNLQQPGTLMDLVALHSSGELLVLELLLHALGLDGGDTVRPEIAARHDEPCELIAGQQGAIQGRVIGYSPLRVVR